MCGLARKKEKKRSPKQTLGAEEGAGSLCQGVMLLDFMVFTSHGTSPALCLGCELTLLMGPGLLRCSYV